jgi:hypothetical protein
MANFHLPKETIIQVQHPIPRDGLLVNIQPGKSLPLLRPKFFPILNHRKAQASQSAFLWRTEGTFTCNWNNE